MRTIVTFLCMQITINTIAGTFVVPPEKESQLIIWLQANAVKVGQQPVSETQNSQYPGRQLLSENNYRG